MTPDRRNPTELHRLADEMRFVYLLELRSRRRLLAMGGVNACILAVYAPWWLASLSALTFVAILVRIVLDSFEIDRRRITFEIDER